MLGKLAHFDEVRGFAAEERGRALVLLESFRCAFATIQAAPALATKFARGGDVNASFDELAKILGAPAATATPAAPAAPDKQEPWMMMQIEALLPVALSLALAACTTSRTTMVGQSELPGPPEESQKRMNHGRS